MLSNKITRRWLRNSFGVIVALILLLEIVAVFGIRQFYYGQVQRLLETRADAVASTMDQYSKENPGDFMPRVQRYVSTFPYRETMELMVLDGKMQTIYTSSGFQPAEKSLPDYLKAMNENTKTSVTIGTLDTKQRVMLLAYPYPVTQDPNIAGIRLGTDLKEIDQQIMTLTIGLVVLGTGVLALVLFSNSYFINSIVRPIGQVGETARQIAQGDFKAQLDIDNDDEIGELADTINYMAGELATAERLKNDFISSVSHELRTPLTGIQGWAETLKMDEGKDKALLERGMGIIIGETQRLAGMVEELLDFSHMQSGRMSLIKGKIDGVAELYEAVLMYAQRAQRENIRLVFNDHEVVAPLYGDGNRLRQVFINILDNAIKYSDPEDVVTVTAQVIYNQLHVVVSDTGVGISPDDLPQITTKFYKADSTRRGSGIGLAVAKEIVNRHEGTLTVESVQGKGTTVTLVFPIYKGQVGLVQVEKPPPESEESKGENNMEGPKD